MRHETLAKLQKVAKSCKIYYCDDCDYSTSRKSSWTKHILTIKHLNNASLSVTKPLKKSVKSCKKYVCDKCGGEYKSRNGLWYHKKKCIVDSESEEEEEKKPANNDTVTMPKEVWEAFQHVLENGTNNTNNTNNTNCNNTYNNNITVQVYLDDYCKDAKSIESIKNHIMKEVSLGLKDIVYPANSQLIKDAPSDLFIKEMKKMPAEERPVHCADGKRGKFWVKKEEKGWVKEDVNEGGELQETISLFKGKLYAKASGEIFDKGEKRPNGTTERELMLIQKIRDKCCGNKTVDNNIIAKLATECNIKDAIKDIEKTD